MSQFSPVAAGLQSQETNVTPGSGASSGTTNGSTINGTAAVNNSQNGAAAVDGYLSSLMEAAGLTTNVNQSTINNYVDKASANKTPLDVEVPNPTTDSGSGKTSDDSPQEANAEARKQQGLDGGGSRAFPAVLETAAEKGAYMKLKFIEYSREDAQSPGTTTAPDTYYLPLPENFNVDFNISYDTVETGATGVIAAQMRDSVREAGPDASAATIATAVVGAVGSSLPNLLQKTGYKAIDAAEASMGGLLGGVTAQGAAQEIQKALGQIPNPHPSVFFQGLPMRQFQFAWNLVPLTADDAENLKTMLDEIKRYILPDITGGENSNLKYPATCQISIMGEGKDRYTKFLPCFVENMSINYTGEGTAAFFNDGAPVSTRLTMQFRESQLFTRGKV